MSESELNPYRTPALNRRSQPPDPLARTKFRRIAGTVICTGAAFWCLFPAVALLDRFIPSSPSDQPIDLPILVLLAAIGVVAFLLGFCIRREQKRYIFPLFMVIVTLFLLFPFALGS